MYYQIRQHLKSTLEKGRESDSFEGDHPNSEVHKDSTANETIIEEITSGEEVPMEIDNI